MQNVQKGACARQWFSNGKVGLEVLASGVACAQPEHMCVLFGAAVWHMGESAIYLSGQSASVQLCCYCCGWRSALSCLSFVW